MNYFQSIRRSRDLFIASVAVIFITAHLFLRFVFNVPEIFQDVPLWIVLIVGGIPLVFDLFVKLLRLEFSSDILAGISIVTAVLLDQYLAGSLVVLMLSGGQTLEQYAVRKASSLLEALAQRMPNNAHLKLNEKISDVSIEKIEVGDSLVIYPHEICPVDGIVLEGHSVVDESYLTGEPFLISKTPGVNVISGSINGDGLLIIKAMKQAKDSRYAKIMQVMVDSEQKKPQLRRLGDTLGAYYTPLALLIAGIAWMVSGEAIRFLAVLVIATPCPLLIAIPVAIIGAISLSAKHGIIIKNPAVLEQIDQCHTIIFDKTGTLTYGKPTLTEMLFYNGLSKRELLSLAASVERYSKHPLSGSIIESAKNANLAVHEASQVSEPPGQGISGVVGSHKVTMTSRSLLIKQGKQSFVDRLPQVSGLECVMLVDDELAAHFRFHDTPRANSRSFIDHLRPRHHFDKIMIVSGDREVEVRYLADQIGIKEVYANQTPEEKVRIVDTENKKNKVIYLGDGINDAPALAVATVGIAFGQHSEITSEAADAVIMDNSY